MLQVDQLTKTFGGTVALNNISCNVPTGSIYGLVGSNGCGMLVQ